MTVIQQEPEVVVIPDWLRDLKSFRRWARSDEYPSRGWYAHLNGQLWVDPSMEKAAHNLLKTKFAVVLTPLVEDAKAGLFFGDRMLLTNADAELSTEPDGMFISFDALHAGRAAVSDGDDALEAEGSPDMVLEVIRPTSVKKDTIVLPGLYWRAGVREYWRADARGDKLAFDILQRGAGGFVPADKDDGWIKSAVFGKSFRLTRRVGEAGVSVYDLEVR